MQKELPIPLLLDEEESGNQCAEASQGCARVEDAWVCSALAGRASATTRCRGVGVGVGLAGDTCVRTLDDVLVMCLVEVVANRGVGAGGLDVGATSDVANRRKGNPGTASVSKLTGGTMAILVECAGEVESSDNGLELGEASDRLELGVVGNQETTSNGRERGKGQVVQVGTVDKGKSTPGLGQVGC